MNRQDFRGPSVTYQPQRRTWGAVSFSRCPAFWFPSILTSKQTRPRVTPWVALAPAHMKPKPLLDMAVTLQKSVGVMLQLRSLLSADRR